MESHRGAGLALLVLLVGWQHASAQGGGSSEQGELVVSFKRSIAIVFGIFSLMFSATFVVLVYVKVCRDGDGRLQPNSLFGNNNRSSGLDKSTIEALPFFKFSSLKGKREGLECSVCLSGFDDSEVLRLLPKCKHAFHTDCIDLWLERHSSCPLCRCKVEREDLTFFKYSTSSRFVCRDTSAPLTNDDNLELLVEREANDAGPSSRSGMGESFRKVAEWGRRTLNSLSPEEERRFRLHRTKHRVVLSDAVFKNRWSDLNSSDLTSLNSDMLNAVSSRRFSAFPSPVAPLETTITIKEEMEKKRSAVSIAPPAVDDATPSIASGRGCLSEITSLPRFVHLPAEAGAKNERTMMVWLPIARRTIQWLTGRENTTQPPPVFQV